MQPVVRPFIAQPQDSTCFVIAVYNCLVYLDLPLFNLNEGVQIAKADSGPATNRDGFIEWSKAPLRQALNYHEVLRYGGILMIMHPIFNGHAVFIFPQNDEFVIVNSWLGPNISYLGLREIEDYIADRMLLNIGENWVIDRIVK